MNFKGIIQKAAPFLGAALGGPVGATAGELISRALGTKPDAPDEDLAKALLGATPEQIVALKQQEEQFQLQMKQLDIQSAEEVEQLANEDRGNARARQIAVRDKIPAIGFVVINAGFFAIVGLLTFHDLPAGIKDVVFMLLGALVAAWKDVYGYFYGSSIGSDKKTELLAGKQ